MASISALSPSNSSAPAAGAATPRATQKVLGQNDFLKLLATQFQTQDPMKPMEDTAFIAQMAQFTALEQSGALAQTMTAIRTDQQRATANSYLGHRVLVDAGQGLTVSGDVAAIDTGGAEPRLVIDGSPYPISAVLRVEPVVVTPLPPASPQGA
jgi:flagellar basal-body rod modification protein FlgD